MLSSSTRASSGSSTGVLPDFTICVGPRTEAAGFTGTTWRVTSQSNKCRTAARPSLGSARRARASAIHPGRDMQRLHLGNRPDAGIRAPSAKNRHGAHVGPPCVRVADVRGKEFQKAKAGTLAGGRYQRRPQREIIHKGELIQIRRPPHSHQEFQKTRPAWQSSVMGVKPVQALRAFENNAVVRDEIPAAGFYGFGKVRCVGRMCARLSVTLENHRDLAAIDLL